MSVRVNTLGIRLVHYIQTYLFMDITHLDLIRIQTSLWQQIERRKVQATRKDPIAARCGAEKNRREIYA